MKEWEIWFASFPYEDNPQIVKKRPVIILNVAPIEVLSVKVTSHDIRDSDVYDTPIEHWKDAGLDKPSIARVSKTMRLDQGNFEFKIGDLDTEDQNLILNQYVRYTNECQNVQDETAV